VGVVVVGDGVVGDGVVGAVVVDEAGPEVDVDVVAVPAATGRAEPVLTGPQEARSPADARRPTAAVQRRLTWCGDRALRTGRGGSSGTWHRGAGPCSGLRPPA